MQPDLLGSNKTSFLYGLILWLIIGLIVGANLGLIVGANLGLVMGLFWGLIWIGYNYDQYIVPSEAIKFSREKMLEALIVVLFFMVCFVIMLLFGAIKSLLYSSLDIGQTLFFLLIVLVLGIIAGIIVVPIAGLDSGEIKVRNQPNQGIIESAKNTLIIAIFSSLLFFSLFIFIAWLAGSIWSWKNPLVFVLGMSFLLGFFKAGIPVIQHYVLRFFLWREGSIPFFYADFLNYAHDKKLLKRVGGRYRFFHDLLREYFAEM